MRRFGFGETLAALLVADLLIAAFRWWRGMPDGQVLMGIVFGAIGSVAMAAVLSAADTRD
jgi:hypothetical protein